VIGAKLPTRRDPGGPADHEDLPDFFRREPARLKTLEYPLDNPLLNIPGDEFDLFLRKVLIMVMASVNGLGVMEIFVSAFPDDWHIRCSVLSLRWPKVLFRMNLSSNVLMEQFCNVFDNLSINIRVTELPIISETLKSKFVTFNLQNVGINGATTEIDDHSYTTPLTSLTLLPLSSFPRLIARQLMLLMIC
jgi:hypothetical protein